MHSRVHSIILIAGLLLGLAADASAKKIEIELGAEKVTARTLTGRGTYYVVDLAIPDELVGHHLDSVLLEFFVDVAADPSIGPGYTPLIEVFPLTEEIRDGQPPRYTSAHPSSRPIPIGDGQRVLIDITGIVQGWIASPSTNHGLILGSFRGPRMGDLELRDDLLRSGKVALTTFYY